MRREPVNAYSLKWSMLFHGILLLGILCAPIFPSCRQKPVQIPLDFTVVLDENLVDPNIPDEPEEEEEEETEEEDPPEPEKPEALPPPEKVEAVEQKKPEKKPEKKVVNPKPKPKPRKKPFRKGRRIEKPTPQPPKNDFSKLKPAKPFDATRPVSRKPKTDAKLSADQIRKALAAGARPGTRNQIPQGEIERCILLIKNALYDAWEPPASSEVVVRPPHLEIRFDASGKIVSYRIAQSSGNAFYDQTVLRAAARTLRVRGLSSAFLKQYETMAIEFKLQ